MKSKITYKHQKLLCPICKGNVEVFQEAHNNHHCTKCDLRFHTGAIFKTEG